MAASGNAGNFQSIPALKPGQVPIPTTAGSVNMYMNLDDNLNIWTVDTFKVHRTVGTPPTPYILPPTSVGSLGGIKVGTGMSALPDGTLTVNPATIAIRGAVKPGLGLTVLPDGTLNATGISDLFLNAIFVDSVNGNNATAIPNSLVKKYSTIQAALAVAGAGSTIIVYPGSYSGNTNLWKNQIDYYFYTGAETNRTIPGNMFEAVGSQVCRVFGNGKFDHFDVGSVVKTASGSTFYMEGHEIVSTDGPAINIDSDPAYTMIRADNIISIRSNAISVTSTGGTKRTCINEITANNIENRVSSTSTVPVIHQSGIFDGLININVTEILGSYQLPAAGGNIIRIANSGSGEININGNIRSRHNSGPATVPMIFIDNFGDPTPNLVNTFTINGNISGQVDTGIEVLSYENGTENTVITVNGSISCYNNYILDTSFIAGGGSGTKGSRIHLNGFHVSGATSAMRIREKVRLYLSGRLQGKDIAIEKIATTGAPSQCNLYFEGYVMVMSGGGAVSVSASVGSDTYNVNTIVSSNVSPGGVVPTIVNGTGGGSVDIQTALVA